MTRDERQDVSSDLWIGSNYRGTIEAFTGYGKTRTAVNIINLLRRNDKTRTVTITVPKIQLKEQWESILTQNRMMEHTRVIVVNSLIRMPKFKTSLLILDEIHRYAAETFSQVFEVVDYSFILGLTATLSRLDGKHSLLQEKCPIIDRVSILDAKRNGWISPYREYNLGIEMSQEEAAVYSNLRTQFQSMFDKFDNDFTVLLNCSYSIVPKLVPADPAIGRDAFVPLPQAVRLAQRYGWRGNTANQAYRISQENRTRARGTKVSVWGGDADHQYHPDRLHGYAVNGMRLMKEMKDFVHRSPSKLQVAAQLINTFSVKTIVFAELTETADKLKEILGDKAVVYHSGIKARIVDGVKIAGAKLKRMAIELIKTSETVLAICTAKSLDEGFDYPEAQLGITLSRTSNPTQYIQRRGRVTRKHTYEDGLDKRSWFVNIYVKDTNDKQWLSKSQRGTHAIGVIWVSSAEEIIERELELEEGE